MSEEENENKPVFFRQKDKPIKYGISRHATYYFDERLDDNFNGKDKVLEDLIYEQHEVGNLIDFIPYDGDMVEEYEMELTNRGKRMLELLKVLEANQDD